MAIHQPTLVGGTDAYGNPIARERDPETSHEAAAKITETGKRTRHAEIVLAIVKRFPEGLSYVEIWTECTEAEKADLREAVEVMRRLNDLVKQGVVAKGDLRECRVKGSRMTTWRPV